MDEEFKKLLAGDLWAQDGDRVDMDDPSVQPVINRDEGYTIDFSTDTAPSRARINQLLRELAGAAKEVRMGVSEYDAEVDYPRGAMCQVSGNIYYALLAHDSASPVNPITQNNSTWAIVAGRVADERTVPEVVPNANIFIDGDRADQFSVWWFVQDTGGHPISNVDLQYSKSSTFASGVTTESSYVPGTPISISTNDSDEFYVRIQLSNSAGPSGYSAGKKVRTSPLEPGNIITLRADAGGNAGAVDLSFTQPETNGLTISSYRIQWKGSGQSYNTTDRAVTFNDTATTVTRQVTGIPITGTTTFIVKALSNRNTYSPGGNEATVVAEGSAAVPSKPRLAYTTPNSTTVYVYLNNQVETNNRDIQFYEFTHKVNNAAQWSDPPQNGEPIPVFTYTRNRGDTLTVRVRAYNAIGYSEYSDDLNVPAFVPAQPDAPTINVVSSLDIEPGFLKGVVNFSMGNISSPEVVKDRIRQTEIQWWRDGDEANPTNQQDSDYPTTSDNDYTISQIFPVVGNLTADTDIIVRARWRNNSTTNGGWSAWSDNFTLTSASAPSGNMVFTPGNITMREGTTSMLSTRLSRRPIDDVTVAITRDNTDITLSTSSLTFTADNWNVDQTITITAAEDADLVADDAILSFAISGGLDPTTDTISVRINERARILTNFNNVERNIRIPRGANARIWFALTAQPDSNVSIYRENIHSSLPASIGDANNRTITFTPNNWSRAQFWDIRTSNITIPDDENPIVATFTVSGAINETITKNIVRTEPGAGGLVSLNIQNAANPDGTSTGVGLSNTIQVDCGRVPAAAFIVGCLPLDPSITITPSTLTFTRLNWNVPQTLTISAPLTSNINGQSALSLEPRSTVNDVIPQTISVPTRSPVNLLRDTFRIPEGGFIISQIRPESIIPSGITITPTSNNDGLSFDPTNVKFTTSNWSTRQNIKISASNDVDITEENDPVLFTITPSSLNLPSRSVPTTVPEPTNSIINVRTRTSQFHDWDPINAADFRGYPLITAELINDALEIVSLSANVIDNNTNLAVDFTISGSLRFQVGSTTPGNYITILFRDSNGIITPLPSGSYTFTLDAGSSTLESIPTYSFEFTITRS